MTPQYRQSFIAALSGHVALIIAAVVVSVVPGYLRPKVVDVPVDWLTVRTDLPLQRRAPPAAERAPAPPAPDDVKEPLTPAMPPDPLPPRPPDRPPDRAPPVKPDRDPAALPDRTHPPDKPTPVSPPGVERASTNRVPVKIGARTVRTVPAPGGPRSRRPIQLSPGDLARELNVNVPVGQYDSAPMDEVQRCLILIKRALYDAWNQPAAADAGARPGALEVRFDLSGRMVSYRLTQSSGSEGFDRSVLLAARAVTRVEGLSVRFLKDYPRLTIEFKLSD